MVSCEHTEWEHIASNLEGIETIVDTFRCVDCGKIIEERGTLT